MLEIGVDFFKFVIVFLIYLRVVYKIYFIDKMKEVVKFLINRYSV